MNRRDFLQAGGAMAAGVTFPALPPRSADPQPLQSHVSDASAQGPPAAATTSGGATGAEARAAWMAVLAKLAEPVLTNLAHGTLKAKMPCEAAPGQEAARKKFTHLEAFGRLMSGIAPWLELSTTAPARASAAGSETAPASAATAGSATAAGSTPASASAPSAASGTAAADATEERARTRYADLARKALIAATTPSSPDVLNFIDGAQALVDAAFLAQAILRAPRALWEPLDRAARANVIQAFTSTRVHQPGFNNWLLFAATVEAALFKMSAGATWDRMRIDYALRQHEQWYKGDGLYGDGPDFHWDYYNSFVIHPMLLDVLDACGRESAAWQALQAPMLARAQRYAVIQERLVAPDGSYPAIGRSLAYRCGAFHLLADVSMRRALPEALPPAQARHALTLVIHRTMDAPETFDAQGWLRIGLCGHQPGVGETYISTGSLYLCSEALLPLGLPADDPFWRAPATPITSQRAWTGQAFPIDHALPR